MKTSITALIATVVFISAGAAHAASCADGEELYAKADLNGDGVITKDEVREMRSDAFSRLDRNGDGVAVASDAPRRFSDRYFEKFEPLRAKFDQDGDGRLGKSEFIDAPMTGFDKADQNGDGELTQDELASRTDRNC
ncbi:MAG: EF-hand domain-containing protein [Oricola sp.]|nr:EF-hand domain-containing protein [Oricola sp.]